MQAHLLISIVAFALGTHGFAHDSAYEHDLHVRSDDGYDAVLYARGFLDALDGLQYQPAAGDEYDSVIAASAALGKRARGKINAPKSGKDQDISKLLEDAHQRSKSSGKDMHKLATNLVEHGTLTPEEIRKVIRG